MTALRAALGAVSGGLEGARQAEALRQKQKLDEENAAFSRAGMLKSLGFTPRAVRDTADPAAMNVVSLDTPTLAPRGASQAFASAMQQGMGVDPSQRRLGAMDTQSTAKPLTAALGSAEAKLKDFERQRSSLRANPNMQMNLPGVGRIGFDPEESEEQKAERAYQNAMRLEEGKRSFSARDADAKAKKDARAKAEADKAAIDELVESGMTRSQAVQALRLDAKYGDINKTPSVKATERGQDISAATARQDREAAKEKAGGTSSANEIEKRLPVGARNDIADYNAAIRTLQEAEKEVANNPKAFGLMPALYSKGGDLGRYVRERSEKDKSEAYTKARAQLQSSLMKLRKTQFGTQMTKLEKDTGEEVFPSGAESSKRLTQMLSVLVGNAEQLRRGVYEANNAPDLYTPIVSDTQAPPAAKPATAGSGGRKPALTIDQWMDANPQRAGESDEAYMSRARTSREGK